MVWVVFQGTPVVVKGQLTETKHLRVSKIVDQPTPRPVSWPPGLKKPGTVWGNQKVKLGS